eukprot:1039401-Prymnesium_polylepis.1
MQKSRFSAPWYMEFTPEESENENVVSLDEVAFAITGYAAAIAELDMGKFMSGLCHTGTGYIVRVPKATCYTMKGKFWLRMANHTSTRTITSSHSQFTRRVRARRSAPACPISPHRPRPPGL